ncbi:MAG TPA: hypothetical protein VGX68_20010 [Thermoanaerobaculia bacterium]|jgi:hypothetical protein|nr:hypothetical protein [Thermoanaerobaculia bacterium]
MKLRLFLADSAEVREGLLFMLGGGWTEVGPQSQPFALAGIIEVTWEETNRKRHLEFLIEDEDGRPLNVATPIGEQPFKIAADFEVGRPPGAPGRSFNLPIAVTVPPVPWTPGRRYIVKAVVDGEAMDKVAFEVRPQPQLPPQPK